MTILLALNLKIIFFEVFPILNSF